jgi:hypothetical protein
VRQLPNTYSGMVPRRRGLESVRAEVTADDRVDLLACDELGGLDACATPGRDARIGVRLPFQRVRIDNEQVGSSPETRVYVRVKSC